MTSTTLSGVIMSKDGRHPWRNRTWLAGLFDAVAGGVLGVVVYLGFTEGIGMVETMAAIFQTGLALAVHLGVVRDGEDKTTPVDDPLGRDGLPLLPFRKLEDLHEASELGDIDRVRELMGQLPH